jgi:hypothetical protein
MTTCAFTEQVKPAFLNLLASQARFKTTDTEDVDATLSGLDELDSLERAVMLAWAESTRDINPGMLSDVKKGLCRYTLKTERYLQKMLLDSQD